MKEQDKKKWQFKNPIYVHTHTHTYAHTQAIQYARKKWDDKSISDDHQFDFEYVC